MMSTATDPEYLRTNSERVIAEAEGMGLIVDLPEDNELQIDIDSGTDMDRFRRSFEILKRELGIIDDDVTITPSRNKVDGRHIRVRMGFDLSPIQRIALQAACGSDPIRELLSLVRLFAGDEHPTLFLEKKPLKEAA